MTKEFIKELRDDATTVEPRFAAASILSSLLSPIAFVLGVATVVGYGPIAETMTLMGLPAWSLPVIGLLEIAAAVALVVPVAAFFGALAMIAICGVGASLYLRLAERGLALVLAAIAVVFVVDLFVRAPELGQKGRRLWSSAKT